LFPWPPEALVHLPSQAAGGPTTPRASVELTEDECTRLDSSLGSKGADGRGTGRFNRARATNILTTTWICQGTSPAAPRKPVRYEGSPQSRSPASAAARRGAHDKRAGSLAKGGTSPLNEGDPACDGRGQPRRWPGCELSGGDREGVERTEMAPPRSPAIRHGKDMGPPSPLPRPEDCHTIEGTCWTVRRPDAGLPAPRPGQRD
jgi:hypothetical protein